MTNKITAEAADLVLMTDAELGEWIGYCDNQHEVHGELVDSSHLINGKWHHVRSLLLELQTSRKQNIEDEKELMRLRKIEREAGRVITAFYDGSLDIHMANKLSAALSSHQEEKE